MSVIYMKKWRQKWVCLNHEIIRFPYYDLSVQNCDVKSSAMFRMTHVLHNKKSLQQLSDGLSFLLASVEFILELEGART